MTKKEILKIIEQNKDILTPENYQGILQNIDIFTEAEKEAIVNYLTMAKEMLEVNNRFMEAQCALYKETGDTLKGIGEDLKSDAKKAREEAEILEEKGAAKEAEDLISNL